jgi:hypothetical protein
MLSLQGTLEVVVDVNLVSKDGERWGVLLLRIQVELVRNERVSGEIWRNRVRQISHF